MRLCVLAALLISQLAVHAYGLSSARAYCTSKEFKSSHCGWASQSERSKMWDYVVFRGQAEPMPEAPAMVSGNQQYGLFKGRVMALACKGKVKVHAVYQLLSDPKKNSPDATPVYLIGSTESVAGNIPVTRCELQLPMALLLNATSKAPIVASLKGAQEVNCKTCSKASGGPHACPMTKGKWYSDSFTAEVPGCGFSDSKGFSPSIAMMSMEAGSSIRLAQFDVTPEA